MRREIMQVVPEIRHGPGRPLVNVGRGLPRANDRPTLGNLMTDCLLYNAGTQREVQKVIVDAGRPVLVMGSAERYFRSTRMVPFFMSEIQGVMLTRNGRIGDGLWDYARELEKQGEVSIVMHRKPVFISPVWHSILFELVPAKGSGTSCLYRSCEVYSLGITDRKRSIRGSIGIVVRGPRLPGTAMGKEFTGITVATALQRCARVPTMDMPESRAISIETAIKVGEFMNRFWDNAHRKVVPEIARRIGGAFNLHASALVVKKLNDRRNPFTEV